MRIPTLLSIGLLFFAPSLHGQAFVLIVSGSGGEPTYSNEFHTWGTAMVDAARGRFNLPNDRVVYLAEDPARDRNRITARATREEVESRIRDVARRAGPNDRILILLIGHGSSDSRGARLLLPGQNLTAADLAKLLDLFPTQRIAVVNAASASGDFHEALAGRNRTVITATRTGLERNATVFGRYFVQAFSGDVADIDKDGRVSVLEAFDYAAREVERHYTSRNLLQTEHARLEGDREIARSFHIASSSTATAAAAGSPEVQRLIEERDRLEAAVAALRTRRSEMDAESYEAELERLLVEVALKNRAIRERGGSR